MREMRRYTVAGEEWISLADVCEDIGIGSELATEPLLLMMIEPEDRCEVEGEWLVTDAGAFDLASIVPRKGYKQRHKPGPKKGNGHKRPIFRQVYRLYKLQILNGVYLEGDALPSTAAMKARFGAVDDKAIWRGRKLLEEEGLVTITPGRGSQAIVNSKHKYRSDVANGVIQQGRRALLAELEAFNA